MGWKNQKFNYGVNHRNGPCYGCRSRNATCHGTCELYKEWESTHIDIRTKYVKEQAFEYEQRRYEIQRAFECKEAWKHAGRSLK